jgi:hypothetical protein
VSDSLYGVYLGQGLIVTAAHVGSFKPPARISADVRDLDAGTPLASNEKLLEQPELCYRGLTG